MYKLFVFVFILFSVSSFATATPIPKADKPLIEKLMSFHKQGEEDQRQDLPQSAACVDVPTPYLRNCWQGYFSEGFKKSISMGAFQARIYFPTNSDPEPLKIAWAFSLGMAMATTQQAFTARMLQDFPMPDLMKSNKYKKYYMEGWAYYAYITFGHEEAIQSCRSFLIQDHLCHWGMGIGFFTDRRHLTTGSNFSKDFISGFLYTQAFLSEPNASVKGKNSALAMAQFMRKFLSNQKDDLDKEKTKCAEEKHILECAHLF